MQPHKYDPLLDERPPSPAGAVIGAIAGVAAGIGAGLLRIKNRAAHVIFDAIHNDKTGKIAEDFFQEGTVLNNLRGKVADNKAVKIAGEIYDIVKAGVENAQNKIDAIKKISWGKRPWGSRSTIKELNNILKVDGEEMETASKAFYHAEISAMAGKMKWADKLALTTTTQKAGAIAFGVVAAVGLGALVKKGIDRLTTQADDHKLYTQLAQSQALAAQQPLSEGNSR